MIRFWDLEAKDPRAFFPHADISSFHDLMLCPPQLAQWGRVPAPAGCQTRTCGHHQNCCAGPGLLGKMRLE